MKRVRGRRGELRRGRGGGRGDGAVWMRDNLPSGASYVSVNSVFGKEESETREVFILRSSRMYICIGKREKPAIK